MSVRKRTELPLRVQLYVAAVVLAAATVFALWLRAWTSAPLLDPGTLPVVLLFAVLAAMAVQFPIPTAPNRNVNAIMAVQFGSLLLLGTPAAMALVALGTVAGKITLATRRIVRRKPPRVRPEDTLFNACQLALATGIAGTVYYRLLPPNVPAVDGLARLENLWAVPAAAITMYLANTLAVAGAISIHQKRDLLEVWRFGRQRDVLQEAGLALLGLVTARTATYDPWIPLVMVLPAWIIYLCTKRNVQLVEQTIGAVEALADVVDRRDQYTFQHSKRVADYAERIARAMKLPADDVEQIRLAARVHDLGKIGVPNDVLHKPGNLTEDEWALMRNHPAMGYEILAKFPEYRSGRELVLAHHERYDGQGYPNGLSGRRLPLGAQIISVADTIDAMTSDRPYRKGLPVETALAALRQGRGSQFHPDVVDTVERLMAGDGARPPLVIVAPATAAAGAGA